MRGLVLLGMLLALGCEQAAEPPLADQAFVDVMVALRRASYEVEDEAEWQARKTAVLAEAGLSEGELEAYVKHFAEDPGHLAAMWDSVATRLRDDAKAEQ